jgi:hypothetical protein
MIEPKYKPGQAIIDKARFIANVGEGDDTVSLWWVHDNPRYLLVYGWDSFGVYIQRDADGARMPTGFPSKHVGLTAEHTERCYRRIAANVPALLAYANMLYGASHA